MSDFRSRLYEEHSELNQRTEKLKNFIVSEKFDDLPEVDKVDLKEQFKHMEAYSSVLNRRVSRCCNNG